MTRPGRHRISRPRPLLAHPGLRGRGCWEQSTSLHPPQPFPVWGTGPGLGRGQKGSQSLSHREGTVGSGVVVSVGSTERMGGAVSPSLLSESLTVSLWGELEPCTGLRPHRLLLSPGLCLPGSPPSEGAAAPSFKASVQWESRGPERATGSLQGTEGAAMEVPALEAGLTGDAAGPSALERGDVLEVGLARHVSAQLGPLDAPGWSWRHRQDTARLPNSAAGLG